MTRRDRTVLLLSALASLYLLVLAPAEAAWFAPLVMLAVPLLLGRYVGEEKIARFVALRTPPRRRRDMRSARGSCARVTRLVPPRGGRLIATSLANRPPPVLVVSR